MAISEKRISINNPLGGEYQVFLSFELDTRRGFTDTLYHALVDVGISVFIGEEELQLGNRLSGNFLQVIDDCRCYIPIFSLNYASSHWCLHELTRMMENISKSREDGNKKMILPIFYGVTPNDVMLETPLYRDKILELEQTMEDQKEKFSFEDVEKWQQALRRIRGIRAFDLQDYSGDGDLAKAVLDEVMSNDMNIAISPIELVIKDQDLEHMDYIESNYSTRWLIKIFGMEGIGKTTLARVQYNKLSIHFKHRSFVENIRERSLHKGIECIQKQLIEDITRSPCDVSTVNEKIKVIIPQFRILVLLDDIDDDTQWKALWGCTNQHFWFKRGSIIIITSRNNRFSLTAGQAGSSFDLKPLSFDQSLTLFHRHAFQKDYPCRGYETISRDIVSTTGSLPLTLEVIGSFLREKSKRVWEDTFTKLKEVIGQEVCDQKVQKTLRIIHEALDDRKQKIFLDIACFYIGSSMQSPTYMWEACGFNPRDGIKALRRMSLIKIEKDGKIMMHNQLRDFGREIVSLENPNKPQERSRLWSYKDAADVFDKNLGTNKIEALCLDKCGCKRSYTCEQFKELTNLRFLHMCGLNFIGDFSNLLPQLRWLQWENCPLDFAATNFHPKKLVVLNLLWSEISEDWGGWGPLQMAVELKVLNLTGCQSLRRTPDLSSFKSLEILIIEECENLEEIHPSIGDIETLLFLNVKRCERLKELPEAIGGLKELRELLINETDIREIPILGGGLMKLETLCASWCPQLSQIPESMAYLSSLTQLDLSHSEIEKLPESIGSLVSLTHLDLSYSSIGELPHSMGSLVLLTHLDLSHSGIGEFLESMGSLESLTQLDLSYTGVEELPKSIGSLKKLETLRLRLVVRI